MRSRLTLHQLEAFIEVAAQSSFRAAAQRLHISQPALTRLIQAAEEAVGERLFDRTTRQVALTPLGAEFLPMARTLLQELHSSLDELARYRGGQRGQLTLAALPSLGAGLLPEVVAEFVRTWPDVRLTMHAPHSLEIQRMVREGEADLGIGLRPAADSGMHYEHLIDDPFVLVCARSHPLARRRRCTWNMLQDYPLISMGRTTSAYVMTRAVLDELGLDIKPAYEIGGQPLMGRLLAGGLGVAALPRLVLPQLSTPGLRLIPLEAPTLCRPLGLLSRGQGRTLSAPARNFAALLRAHAEQSQPAYSEAS